jgi:predicted dienelactone hydrolase
MAPDPGHPAIALAVWYPSHAAVSGQPLELFQQAVARDAAVAAGHHPMVVISHGQGGSFGGHYDTALALAAAGYVVVALTHTGDNYRDQTGVLNIMDRPRQVSRVIDYMLAAWPGHDSIDAARIGPFGFSAGGFTALVSAGGVADLSLSTPYCITHPAQYTCKLIEAHGWRVWTASALRLRDTRTKAIVVAAPALAYAFMPYGLRGVTVPVQLWRADADQILPAPDYADAVRTELPSPPDFQTVPSAGHFDFLAPCSNALTRVAPAICQDPPGFDRAAFHQRLNASVVAFFKRTL